MVVLYKFLYALCIPCFDVYHLWERDPDYHFAILGNIDLLYDYITDREVKLKFLCGTVVMPIPWVPSLRIY